MIEGFWIVRLLPPPVTSGGVILFMNGKVFGGDNGFTWVGTYAMSGAALRVRVQVHNFDKDIKSVLGVDGDYEMHFSGTLEGNLVTGVVMIANQPQHSLAVRLERHSAL
jgi:hypothetical protein